MTSHAIAGALSAAGRITKTVNKGLVQVLEDDEFLIKRENRQRREHHRFLRRIGGDVWCGLYGAVSGVFLDPYHGARKGSVEGFLAAGANRISWQHNCQTGSRGALRCHR